MSNVTEMTSEEILFEIGSVHVDIQMRDPYDCPENFYEDGELSEEEAQRKVDRLTARLEELEKELNAR